MPPTEKIMIRQKKQFFILKAEIFCQGSPGSSVDKIYPVNTSKIESQESLYPPKKGNCMNRLVGIVILFCLTLGVRVQSSYGDDEKIELINFIAAVLMEKNVSLSIPVITAHIPKINREYVFDQVRMVKYDKGGVTRFELFIEYPEDFVFQAFCNISGSINARDEIIVEQILFFTPDDQITATWIVDKDGDAKTDSITHRVNEDESIKAHQPRSHYLLQFHHGYGDLLLEESYLLCGIILPDLESQ